MRLAPRARLVAELAAARARFPRPLGVEETMKSTYRMLKKTAVRPHAAQSGRDQGPLLESVASFNQRPVECIKSLLPRMK